MENVLEVYKRPLDADYPVVCMVAPLCIRHLSQRLRADYWIDWNLFIRLNRVAG